MTCNATPNDKEGWLSRSLESLRIAADREICLSGLSDWYADTSSRKFTRRRMICSEPAIWLEETCVDSALCLLFKLWLLFSGLPVLASQSSSLINFVSSERSVSMTRSNSVLPRCRKGISIQSRVPRSDVLRVDSAMYDLYYRKLPIHRPQKISGCCTYHEKAQLPKYLEKWRHLAALGSSLLKEAEGAISMGNPRVRTKRCHHLKFQ